MRDAGLKFVAVSYDVDEVFPPETPTMEVPEYLSQLKGNAYPQPLGEREILITADTVVILGEKVLGKPADDEAARAMLGELSGSEHLVVTGVTIRSAEKCRSFSTTTKVRFAELTPEQIDYYVKSYSPLDKAGSYGIQEWIGYVGIVGVEGSYYNVMGLPIQRLCVELTSFLG